MSKKSKLKKMIIRFLTVILSVTILIGISGIAVYNFVIIPKYNSMLSSGEKRGEKLSNKDLVLFAKYLTDKQLITNLINIDKKTAKDVLSALLELEEDIDIIEEVETPAPKQISVFTQMEQVPLPTPVPTPYVPPKIPEEVKVTKEQQSAYDRIMAAAKKEEIMIGLAIISKVDLQKVVTLNSQGKKAELKTYLKSVLTSKEISDSLKLYRKYKHLL